MLDDNHFMKEALRLAHLAYDAGEIPVGAVVVWGEKIIGRGYNQVEQLCDSTAHAEMLAITAACNTIGAKYLMEATLYVTLEPCLMCAGAAFWSKVGRIVFGASDVKNGYKRIAGTQNPFHPKASISYGILEQDCAQLMKDFFAARR
ncbi:MAG: nucleoside deaminase [Chitinophagaceae bacterium]|nr:nucleoside deaminase [Chitinophagaceae bacterium]